MLFSSLLFLYAFLPFVLLGYILLQPRYRNNFLLIASLIFFAWGGVSFTFIFIGSILINFFSGILISKYDAKPGRKKVTLIIAIVLNLLVLCIFKYAGFIIENINSLLDDLGTKELQQPSIPLPIGISFYTFHGLSYIIDVYRGTTKAQRKISDLGLYISFFPQLIAGPIVRYKDISAQLTDRTFTYLSFNNGITRFLLGLGKKVLIANTLAVVADNIFKMAPEQLGTATAWIGIIAYTFQIYFDFSGYSDMAIGLALAFGFQFKENFNFPYLAESIKDFWRRWHISLSTWFRDYLYIPLGGNREGKWKMYRNYIIVFFITGLWHGASWNFVLWGFLHGLFIVIESLGFGKLLEKIWRPFRISYSLLIVLSAWVLFRSDDLSDATNYYRAMLGIHNTNPALIQPLSQSINTEQVLALIIAILGSFGLFNISGNFITRLREKGSAWVHNTVDLLKLLASISILVVCTAYLISGSYNPFIYFRF